MYLAIQKGQSERKKKSVNASPVRIVWVCVRACARFFCDMSIAADKTWEN